MKELNFDLKSRMLKGYPKFTKKGAVSPYGEMTPFVFNGRLMRMELIDKTRGIDPYDKDICACIRDVETGKILSYFGHGCYYFSGYSEGNKFYTLAVESKLPEFSGDTIMIFETEDLIHFKKRVLLKNEGWKYFNTSLCKGEDGYVLVLESNTQPYAGDFPFTCFFATSKDMVHWEFMDNERAYPWARYCGGPYMRYCNGYYYLFCVTELPCFRFTTYLYRTKDFETWEVGKYNPVLMVSDEDRKIAPHAADLDEKMLELIKTGFNSNLSDWDMCEYGGKTVINYAVGNQMGFYYMAEAEYDGTIQQLLENFFE